MGTDEGAVAAEAPHRPIYAPDEVLKLLQDIPEDKRTFSTVRLLDALSSQLETLKAINEVKKQLDTATLSDMSKIIMLFLKNIYNLVSGLPGSLRFDALEDVIARTGLLSPFVNGVKKVDETIALELGLPSNENLADNHEELIRLAAAGIVCYYHYTNYPTHPLYFPSDDATLLYTTIALRSCQDRAAADKIGAQLQEAGGLITVAQIRWLMHYFRAQLSGLCGAVYLSLGDAQAHKAQLVAQQADFLGLIKAVPENPTGYSYYVRTCLQFQQLSAAGLFASKGAVVAAHHRAAFYSAQLAAQRAIALALAGGGSSSTAGAAGAGAGGVSAAALAAVGAADAAAAAAPPALVRAGELRSFLETVKTGLAEEKGVLPEVYGDLIALDPVDERLLETKVEPMVAGGVPDDGEVFALTDLMYPTLPPQGLPRGAVAVGKPE